MIKHEIITGFGRNHTNKSMGNPYPLIGLDNIRAMVDNPKAIAKEKAQWIIPSTFHSRNFEEQFKYGSYLFLWADLDKEPQSIAFVSSVLETLIDSDYEIYTTSSATKENQKARILIPLANELSPNEWFNCQSFLNKLLCEHEITPDGANKGYAQLCYLPNRGEYYGCVSRRNGKYFNPAFNWRHLQLTERTECTDDYRGLLKSTETTDVRGGAVEVVYEKLPTDCYPKEEGERNWTLFNFSRYLKKIYPDAELDSLRSVVLGWHNYFIDALGTKVFSETWSDFRRGWLKIKVPYGEGIKAIIHNIDLVVPIPDEFIKLGYTSNREFKLLLICNQLQLLQGEGEFFLSCRTAGELLDYNHTSTAKMLDSFVADGILEIVGAYTTTKASRYKYIWKHL